jgi:hypothetical protein
LAPRIIAAMLATATLLAFATAVMAPVNQRPELWRGPPDEHGHRSAARYYVDNWLPPRVGDPATLDSYSRDYGFSYLNDTDPAYFFAGKFAAALSPLRVDLDIGFRLFNVFLLAVLAAFCMLRPAAYLIFLPLVLSPQLWYIFGYFNGDAWPLFLCVLISYQVAVPASIFNRYLDNPGVWRGAHGALLMATLVGLLLLSKKNFLSFAALLPAFIALTRFGRVAGVLTASAALLGAAAFLRWISVDEQTMRPLMGAIAIAVIIAALLPKATRQARFRIASKFAVIALLAGGFVLARQQADLMVNESLAKKRAAVIALQEKLAKPDYKPSAIYSGTPKPHFHGIEMRKRGIPLSDLLVAPWSWPAKTFITATGSYGWLEFNASFAYYATMFAAYIFLFASYAFGVARSGSADVIGSFVIVVIFSALTIAVSLHHSWHHDFQAQGRYLFPIAAMLGLGLYHARETLPRTPVMAAAVTCFGLSLYSFVWVGLRNLVNSFASN